MKKMLNISIDEKSKVLILGGSSDIGITLIKELLKNDNMEIYAHCSSNEKEFEKN